MPHGFDSDLIRTMAIALPHCLSAGDGRLLDNPQELEREIGLHAGYTFALWPSGS
jgi:hypothetical protein